MKALAKLDFDARTFSKQLALPFAVLLVSALVWADNKPWETKPYHAWTDKDVQFIMSHSPWVRSTTIRRTWVPVSHEWVAAPQQEISGGIRQSPSVTGTSSGVSSGGAGGSAAPDIDMNVYVYWDSSRVMRAATARQKVLHGEMKDSDVDAYAHASQDEYELALSMQDMTPFLKNDESFFQVHAFLEMKRSKLKLLPTHVVYEKDANGALKQAVFYFPKKTASGEPTIGSDETDVEFSCKLADSTLRVGFDPRKMMDQSGPDL